MIKLLEPKEISCRVQQITSSSLTLLLYVTSRAGQNKLDDKYGPLGWKDSYREIGSELYCTISAWNENIGEWIAKEDVGTASAYEKQKGRASDAFKRACVKHGIARELYSAPVIRIPSNQCTIKDKKDKNGNTVYYTYDEFSVNKITYNAYNEIDELEIVNQHMDIVFKKYPSLKIDSIKFKVLLETMEKADVTENQILELFNLTSLKEMNIEQFSKACIKLQKTIEKNLKTQEGA